MSDVHEEIIPPEGACRDRIPAPRPPYCVPPTHSSAQASRDERRHRLELSVGFADLDGVDISGDSDEHRAEPPPSGIDDTGPNTSRTDRQSVVGKPERDEDDTDPR